MPSAFVKNWTVPVWGLFGLGLLALMYFAKPILIPAVIALLTALMLAPVVHLFERVMPPAVAAFLILAMFVAGVSVVLNYTVDPMRLWLERLPAEMLTLESKLSSVKRSIESVKDTTERIGDLATLASSRDRHECIFSTLSSGVGGVSDPRLTVSPPDLSVQRMRMVDDKLVQSLWSLEAPRTVLRDARHAT